MVRLPWWWWTAVAIIAVLAINAFGNDYQTSAEIATVNHTTWLDDYLDSSRHVEPVKVLPMPSRAEIRENVPLINHVRSGKEQCQEFFSDYPNLGDQCQDPKPPQPPASGDRKEQLLEQIYWEVTSR